MRSLVPLLFLIGCVPWSDDADRDGVTEAAGDCNDDDAAIHPGAKDRGGDGVDDNCDGVDGTDGDGDGHASERTGGRDCDDADDDVHPTANEICDGIDNDCDGDEDEEAIDATEWFVDGDGDGFGGGEAELSCTQPVKKIADGSDCDDAAARIFPGALEQCGRDFDCDDVITPCEHLEGDLGPGDADWIFVGTSVGDFAGQSVAAIGDFNGDGYDDLAIGASKEDSGGEVYVIHGPLGGGVGRDYALADADAVYEADEVGAQSGISVAGIGNVDDELGHDLLIGANFAGASGAAYVVFGSDEAGGDLTQADAELIGESDGDEAGWKVAGAGDVDGDGTPDLLIAARNYGPNNEGAVYMVSGADVQTMSLSEATLKYEGVVSQGQAGFDIAGNADFDGDGLADMLIGERSPGIGHAYLDLGRATGMAQAEKNLDNIDVPIVLAGEMAGDEAGSSVAFVGDIDGDGRPDAAIGATRGRLMGDEVGLVYLVLADPLGPLAQGGGDLSGAPAILAGTADGDRVGNAISGAGDVNGDGFDDFLVTCLLCGVGGEVFLVEGPLVGQLDLAQTAAMRFSGTTAGDVMGAGLASADWNADGYGDLLIGAPEGDRMQQGTGHAYVLFGGEP